MGLIYKAIVAMTDDRVIGHDGTLPWHLPEDLKRFSNLTKGHAVLMGRKTYDSIPDKFRPLPGRKNIVISRSKRDYPEGVLCMNLDDIFGGALDRMESEFTSNIVWIIGGAEIYRETLAMVSEIELTRVIGDFTGDTHFPKFEGDFKLLRQEPSTECVYETYVRK